MLPWRMQSCMKIGRMWTGCTRRTHALLKIPGAARRCRQCTDALQQGAALADAMEAGSLLPPHHCRMLAVGLQSGSGDRVMQQIAAQMEETAREALEDAVGKIEPAMVLLTSLMVGLPLWTVMVISP